MRLFSPLLGLLLLTSCSSDSAIGNALDSRVNAGLCPVAGSVYDSSRIVRFADGANARLNNITFTGEITDVRINCRYADKDPIRIDLEVDFAFGKGNASDANAADYEFFVAITRPNGRVLNKSIEVVSSDFSNDDIVVKTHKISPIVIPRADSSVAGTNFELLVGFKLTDEQLKFNRDGRRFLLSTRS